MASKKKTVASSVRREDRAGHMDPRYVASLLDRGSRRDGDGLAFVSGRRSSDDLAQELAEEAVVAMTSGEDGLTEDFERLIDEERGGPFVTSTSRVEFAHDIDASNPEGAFREPFPRT
jgi:hypothetical protein